MILAIVVIFAIAEVSGKAAALLTAILGFLLWQAYNQQTKSEVSI